MKKKYLVLILLIFFNCILFITSCAQKHIRNSDKSERYTNSIGMEFVFIPPGSFLMGSPLSEHGRDDDETQHRVTLSRGFYIQTTEVTQGQWKQVMKNQPWKGRCGVKDNTDRPAVYISWNDCQDFISQLNKLENTNKYRLPTEAEWEYACRAGTNTTFFFGNNANETDQLTWVNDYNKNIDEKYANKVASIKPNPWGLYDMLGNVREWCHDWYGPYPSAAVVDPIGPGSGERRVFRSNRWNAPISSCRSANRSCIENSHVKSSAHIGFRIVFSK